MKRHFVFMLAISLSGCVFGQDKEQYVTQTCNCIIVSSNPEKKSYNAFTPSHAEVDSAESALRRNDSIMHLIRDINRFIRIYHGVNFENHEGHKVLEIYMDFVPDKDGLKLSDGQPDVFYDLATKTFFGFRILGG